MCCHISRGHLTALGYHTSLYVLEASLVKIKIFKSNSVKDKNHSILTVFRFTEGGPKLPKIQYDLTKL